MAIVHQVGKPVNKSERDVIEHLRTGLPNEYHIYHNLELVPQRSGHPYEYDLIVVGSHIAWVIEVKGYLGKIRGNAAHWELPNGRYERSPIPLTNEKARILKTQIEAYSPRLQGSYYVDSLVVLGGKRVHFETNYPQANRVIYLPELSTRLIQHTQSARNKKVARGASQVVCQMLDERFGPLTKYPRIGDYEVVDSAVSRGRYSVTYPARHTLLNAQNRISLKVYQLDTAQTRTKLQRWKRLFMHEAEALSRLGQHPNIAQCYPPFLWDSDKIVLPLEWIDGPTLREALPRINSWPVHNRMHVFRQICAGLNHIHCHGVIHRALAPENIVLSPGDQVKIINFTLAKIHPTEDDLEALFTVATVSQDSVYTPFLHAVDWRYRAPELIHSVHQARPQVDMFSAGAILFELMTGRNPFGSRHSMQENEINRLAVEPGLALPASIRALFENMCAYEPDGRFASMQTVLQKLDKLGY